LLIHISNPVSIDVSFVIIEISPPFPIQVKTLGLPPSLADGKITKPHCFNISLYFSLSIFTKP